MASTQPLFEIDPGWPYLLAGLGLVFGAVVLPEQAKLHQGEQQLAQMQHLVERSDAVAGAYDDFAARVKEGDPTLMRRLAVSQLNLLPQGEVPIVRAESATVPNSAYQRYAIFFKALTRTSAVTKTTTSQFRFDMFGQNREASRKALNNYCEGATMRFTGCEVPKHGFQTTCGERKVPALRLIASPMRLRIRQTRVFVGAELGE